MAQVADKPQGVVVGAGGDPQVLGIPVFVLGSIALGFALVWAIYGGIYFLRASKQTGRSTLVQSKLGAA